MRVFAIADLHLSFGVEGKKMDRFGPAWVNHPERLKERWCALVKQDDFVLLPGDISWAKKLKDALPDLEWIDKLPGQKVMIRGNHEYWWPSLKKLNDLPFDTIHFIHNNAVRFGAVAIAGTRFWDSDEYAYYPQDEVDMKTYEKELERLEYSLKQLDPSAPIKIAMTHYPPLGKEMEESRATKLFEKYHVNRVVFGHLHGIERGTLPFGTLHGIQYSLVSLDYIENTPQLLYGEETIERAENSGQLEIGA